MRRETKIHPKTTAASAAAAGNELQPDQQAGVQQHHGHHHHHHHHHHQQNPVKPKYDPNADKAVENRIAIEEEHERDRISVIEIIRIRLKRFLTTSSVGKAYTQAMILLSVLSCLEFIYQTYLSKHLAIERSQLKTLTIFELFVSSLFTIDWVLSFFIADRKVPFVCSFYSIVDILTVIPIFIFVFNEHIPAQDEVDTVEEFILYTIHALNTTRVLRALRLRKLFYSIEDPVDRCVAEISLKLAIMILFSKFLVC
jgi:hypothetical protein